MLREHGANAHESVIFETPLISGHAEAAVPASAQSVEAQPVGVWDRHESWDIAGKRSEAASLR
jgi:hypothetical protein